MASTTIKKPTTPRSGNTKRAAVNTFFDTETNTGNIMQQSIDLNALSAYLQPSSQPVQELVIQLVDIVLSITSDEKSFTRGEQIAVNTLKSAKILV